MTEREFICWLRGYISHDEMLDKTRVDRIREYLERLELETKR